MANDLTFDTAQLAVLQEKILQYEQRYPLATTAERFAQTVNKLKGAATILFIAHQLPKGLTVDEVFALSQEKATQMRVIEEGQS
jgi:hypothetical protein